MLDGSWDLVEGETEGVRGTPEDAARSKLEITGERHTVTLGEEVFSGTHTINPDTNPDQVAPKLLTTMKKDDVYHLIQAGAGGYGDPLERDLDSILDDLQQEKLTVDHVRREYGVVVDPDTLQIDLRATEELRASMRADRAG